MKAKTTQNQCLLSSICMVLLIAGMLPAVAAVIDNFDDNTFDLNVWDIRHHQTHGGSVSEINQQVRLSGTSVGIEYVYSITTDDQSFLIPEDGTTLEYSVDLVQGGGRDSLLFLVFSANPSPPPSLGGDFYLVAKDEDRIWILKNAGFNAFFSTSEPVKNENVKLVMSLTGAGSSVIINAKVLDLENNNAVLFEQSVTDTSGIDPMAFGSDSQPASLLGRQGAYALSLFHNHTTGVSSEIIMDNATVAIRGPSLAIERALDQAVTLSWPPILETYIVLEASSLEGPWVPQLAPIQLIDGKNQSVLDTVSGTAFFQLRRGRWFEDNFDDGNLDGWQMVFPDPRFETYATLSVTTNGTFRTQGEICPECSNHSILANRPDLVFTDFAASVDLVDWEANSIHVGIAGRVNEAGPYGYIGGLTFNSSQPGQSSIWIDEEGPGGGNLIALFYFDTVDPARDYRLMFGGVSSQLSMQLFDLADLSQPIATATAQDNTYPQGTVAIFSEANAEFDNFVEAGTTP